MHKANYKRLEFLSSEFWELVHNFETVMTASAMRNKLFFVSKPQFLCSLSESMKLWQANVLDICRINFQVFHISCPILPYAYHSFITSLFFFFNVIFSLRLVTLSKIIPPSHPQVPCHFLDFLVSAPVSSSPTVFYLYI